MVSERIIKKILNSQKPAFGRALAVLIAVGLEDLYVEVVVATL